MQNPSRYHPLYASHEFENQKITCVQFAVDGRYLPSIAPNTRLNIVRTPEEPVGRKGEQLACYIQEFLRSDALGILFWDPDIIADPLDMRAMAEAIQENPSAVHTGLVRLWSLTDPHHCIWSHDVFDAPEVFRHGCRLPLSVEPHMTFDEYQMQLRECYQHVSRLGGQSRDHWIHSFTFGFTYLPYRLLQFLDLATLSEFQFPHVDEFVWTQALVWDVPAWLCRHARPKHLHWELSDWLNQPDLENVQWLG